MTAGQWAELIEAYLSGRLSADAFKRRFMEAYDAAVATRASTPTPIQDLAFVVQAYAGDPTARGHDVADDDDLRRGAEQALRGLPATGPSVAEAEREREPAVAHAIEILPPRADGSDGGSGARFERSRIEINSVRIGTFGAVGCLMLLAWVALGVLQFFAIAAQVQAALSWGPAPSTIAAAPLAFVPVVGSVIAFFGAKDVWGWPPLVAGVVFLALPLVSMIGGWRTRRRRFGDHHR